MGRPQGRVPAGEMGDGRTEGVAARAVEMGDGWTEDAVRDVGGGGQDTVLKHAICAAD